MSLSKLHKKFITRSMINELEELLQPKATLLHEDKILQNGKVLRKYLIKFKNYSFHDANG